MTDASGNGALAGKLLALTALVLFAVAGAAWAGWLPYRPETTKALARVFAVVGGLDLAIATFFMVRYR